MKVLIVDDNIPMHRAFARQLGAHVAVITACTEEEAVAKAMTNPDINGILLDGHLTPNTTTVRLLARLREILGTRVKIVACSTEAHVNQQLLAAGADAAEMKLGGNPSKALLKLIS